MELRQTLQLKQQLRLTMELQQAIKLLQLNRLELATLVQQELSENPLLEELPESRPEETPVADLDSPAPDDGPEPKEDDDWKKVIEDYRDSGPLPGGVRKPAEDRPPLEATLSKVEDLYDHLLWQLRMSRVSETQMQIGAELIGNLGDNGYVTWDVVVSIGDRLGQPVEEVDSVRVMIQRFDPVGVASISIEECLLIQARVFYPDEDLVHTIIEDHLPELVGRNVLTLAKRLGVSDEDIEEARAIITSLDPKPGRNFSAEHTHYVVPDVYVQKVIDDYEVILNEDGLPKLRISAYYKDLISGKIKPDTKEYLKRKVRSAVWFLRSIHQRQNTVRLVAESIVKHQRAFLDHGVSELRPLVLRDIAEDIEMHESTISRVTSNKFMHTPQGLYSMKFFFNPRIESSGGEDLASMAVKDKIRTLIAEEDPRKPLSDQQVVDILKGQGVQIARRTVAKYRGQLRILPSSKRVRLG